MNIHFFDFDGTISTKDSFIEFIYFTEGKLKTTLGFALLIPLFILYYLKIVPAARTKEIVLKLFYHKKTKAALFELGRAYINKDIATILRPRALQLLEELKTKGDKIVIVSASLDVWLLPFCELHGFDLICTQLEYQNHQFTGKLKGLNCHGKEKVRFIKAKYDLSKYQKIAAYGDTKGDLYMLELAHEKHYKPFRHRQSSSS